MPGAQSDPARSLGGGLCLALDTTGERCSACVFDVEAMRSLSSAEPVIGRGHAERLMDILATVLAEGGVGYGDLSRIAVSIGPGSFTGIRVGVAAARGLALALAIPAVGVDVLEALAEPHLRQGRAVLAVQDARRGEVYAALHAADGRRLRQPTALAPGALPAFAEAAGAGLPLLLTGSGAGIAAEHLPGVPVRIVDLAGRPAIVETARIGARRPPGLPVRPLYLRSADAKPQASSGLLQRDSSSNPGPGLR